MCDTDQAIAAMALFDTPTICNALDLLRPDRAGISFTTSRLVWARAEEPPMVGIALTATVRADTPADFDAAEAGRRRLAYWTHLAAARASTPPHSPPPSAIRLRYSAAAAPRPCCG